jgi:acyl-CoA synthetase (AMP-forming)/AMP-acid ligase II
VVLSYRELDQRARTIAAALQADAEFGDRAVLLFPSGPDYVAAFFGCLYAGVIAVPAYPPESARRHHQERLLSIIADAEPRLLLTSADLRDALQQIEGAPPLLCVDSLDGALAKTGLNRTCRKTTSPSCNTPPAPPHCPKACRSAMAIWSPTNC